MVKRALLAMIVGCYAAAADAATLHVGMGPSNNGAAFKTISQALPQLAPGDTLVIASGIYRESIDLRMATKLRPSSGAAIVCSGLM